jgi:DHA1 family tetracycline resistance protein-like MFS transporter
MSHTADDIDLKRLFPILLIIFTNILGAGTIIPILPLFAEGEFKGTIFQITLLSAAYFGAQFLAAPWLGRLSDRYGRRPLLIISQAGTVLAFMLFIFARPLGGMIERSGMALPISGGMLILYIARTLDGITGGNLTIAQAYVSDIISVEQRAQGLGLLQAAFGVGFIFGPALGGILSTFGTEAPFVGAAIITAGTLLLTTVTLVESLPPEARVTEEERRQIHVPLRELLNNRALVIVLAIGFFGALAFSAVPAVFALYADHVLFAAVTDQGRARLFIGMMLTFNGLMQVVTQLALLRPLVRRLGERGLLLVGQISLFLGLVGIALVGRAWMVTLLLAPFAFGRGVSEPSLQALTTRFGEARIRGRLLGLNQSARSLALIFGPLWAGYAFERINPRAVFASAGGFVMIGIALAILLLRLPLPMLQTRRYSEHLEGDG